jgi:uncharacterized membrane protein
MLDSFYRHVFMSLLILGLVVFFTVHSVRIVADDWRSACISRFGAMPWKLVYALLSILGLWLVIRGFVLMRVDPLMLWQPPSWTRHLAALLTLPAFILVVAAYVPGNSIKAAVGHPMVAGVKVWALAHLLANGRLADVLLFGSFLAWAIVAFAAARRRDRAVGKTYPRLGWTRTVAVVVLGGLAWLAFARFGHEWLIGVRPFG